MRKSRLLVAGLAMFAAATVPARGVRAQAAQTYSFTLSGPGIAGSLVLTYGTAVDAKYPDAYKVTGISGTFTDTNNSLKIVGASVATASTALDYVEGGVTAAVTTPEPGSLWLVGAGSVGLVGALARRRRTAAA